MDGGHSNIWGISKTFSIFKYPFYELKKLQEANCARFVCYTLLYILQYFKILTRAWKKKQHLRSKVVLVFQDYMQMDRERFLCPRAMEQLMLI